MNTPHPVYYNVFFQLLGRQKVPIAILRVLRRYGYEKDGNCFLVKAQRGLTSHSLRAELSTHLKTGEKAVVAGWSTEGWFDGQRTPETWESLQHHLKEKRRLQRRSRQALQNRRRKP